MALTYGSKGQLPGLPASAIAFERAPQRIEDYSGFTWRDWTLFGLEALSGALMFAPLGLVAGTATFAGIGAAELTLASYDPRSDTWRAPETDEIALTATGIFAPGVLHLGGKAIGSVIKGYGNLKYYGLARSKVAQADQILAKEFQLPSDPAYFERLRSYRTGFNQARRSPFSPNRKIVATTIAELEANRAAFLEGERSLMESISRSDILKPAKQMQFLSASYDLEREIAAVSGDVIKLRNIAESNVRYTSILNTRGRNKEQRRTDAIELIESVRGILGPRYREIFDDLLRSARYNTGGEIRFKLWRFFRKIDPDKANKIKEMMEAVFDKRVKAVRIMASGSASKIKNLWDRVNSSRFYNREVQWAQNFNGADAGRFIAENSYHKVKGAISRWMERRNFKFLGKLFKAARAQQDLENAFIRTGGIVINSSYLYGYRILFTTGVGKFATHTCVMKFRKGATQSKTGKNRFGKEDVIFKATNHDLKKLSEEGSSYWFRVGASKGWFMSRGGRTVNNTVLGKATQILTFLPIQAIRSLGSIISNIKAVVKNFSERGFNKGMNHYLDEMTEAVRNTSMNRFGRLVATTIVGGAIAKMGYKRAGWWVGRALQQTSSAAFTSWKTSAESKRHKHGFGYYFGKKMGIKGMVSNRMQSDMIRGARRYNPGSAGLLARTAGRKIQITKSVPGSGSGRSKGWFG